MSGRELLVIGDRAAAGTARSRGDAGEEVLPEAWRFAGREPIRFELPAARRPWNWLELDRQEAATMWRILDEFVVFLNHRYVERTEHRIPPCWPEHGAVVEELSTLFWSRWQAFESPEASVALAQAFHSYTLPGFLEHLMQWIGPDRLRRCQAGKHERRAAEPPPGGDEWEMRRYDIADADVALRRGAPAKPGRQRATYDGADE